MQQNLLKEGYYLDSDTVDGNLVLQEIKRLINGKLGTESILDAEELQLIYKIPDPKNKLLNNGLNYPLEIEITEQSKNSTAVIEILPTVGGTVQVNIGPVAI